MRKVNHKPNFFIIGAPKCGTTALSEYLRDHPNIFFSTPKELHFFNTDFANRYTRSMVDYLQFFAAAEPWHERIGEGSVFYLASTSAVPKILAFNPDARFIVMLRNPLDAVYSWHSQALYSFGETIRSFEDAWNLQGDRMAGRHIPRSCTEAKTLAYGWLFRFGEQMERLYDIVPRTNVHVVMFEDFARDTSRAYGKVLGFLGLEFHDIGKFAAANRNKRFRSWYVERALRCASRTKWALGVHRPFGIRERVRAWNTSVAPRRPLNTAMRARLREYFHDDVCRLSEVLRRDLSAWVDSNGAPRQ